MRWSLLLRYGRPALLAAICVAVLALSWLDAAWATPEQNPAGQTIPSPTPRRTQPRRTPLPTVLPTASPLPLPPGAVVVGPESELQISVDGGDCIAWLTAGDIALESALSLNPYPVSEVPQPNPAYLYVCSCELKLFDLAGQLIDPLPFMSLSDQTVVPLPFAGPLDVCFTYTDADLVLTQQNPALFTVLRFDVVPGTWSEMPLRLDPVNRSACGATNWPGIFALAVRVATPENLPNTSGELLNATATAQAVLSAATGVPPAINTNTTTAASTVLPATQLPDRAGGIVPEQPASAAADGSALAPAAEAADGIDIPVWAWLGVVVLLLLVGVLLYRQRATRA